LAHRGREMQSYATSTTMDSAIPSVIWCSKK
jgi:hypothetical protein